MTRFADKSFTVKTGARDPKGCEHGWVNSEKGTCVLCGTRVHEPVPPIEMHEAEPGHLVSADGRSHQYFAKP